MPASFPLSVYRVTPDVCHMHADVPESAKSVWAIACVRDQTVGPVEIPRSNGESAREH